MFIGHYGAGFGAKYLDNKPSLGTYFFAAQFLDLLWPLLVLLGIEKVKIEPGLMAANPLDFTYYPFSHSLLFVLIWSVLFGLIYFAVKKDFKSSIFLGLLVSSHWFLDLIVHGPDLPIFPWLDLKIGLGLWNSPAASLIIESLIFIAGIYIYIKATRAKNKIGNISLWSLITFFLVIYIMSLFGSAPPSVQAIAVTGLSQWLFVAWGYWVDKNRETVEIVSISDPEKNKV